MKRAISDPASYGSAPGAGDRLAAARDKRIELADREYTIKLNLCGELVDVTYTLGAGDEPAVTGADVRGGMVDADHFAQFVLDDWTDSIRRHLRADAEEAQAAAADARADALESVYEVVA